MMRLLLGLLGNSSTIKRNLKRGEIEFLRAFSLPRMKMHTVNS